MNLFSLKMRLLLLAFAGMMLFTSCGGDEILYPEDAWGIRHDKTLADYEAVATNASPYNTAEYPDFSPVVTFSYSLEAGKDPEYVASGVLIKDNWILTAGHNFFLSAEQSSPAPASAIVVLTGNDPNNPTGTYEVEQLVFHPTWLAQNDGLFELGNDMCLVKLKTSVAGVTVAQLVSSDSEPLNGTAWYAGYGDYSKRPGQDKNLLSKKHAIQNFLDRKNTGIISSIGDTDYTGGLLAFDFDDPDGVVNSLGDDYQSADEGLLGSGTSFSGALDFEGATVEGDSGGPLFVKDGGVWKVAGVLSGGLDEPVQGYKEGGYGDISVFTRVQPLYTWIQSVIQ